MNPSITHPVIKVMDRMNAIVQSHPECPSDMPYCPDALYRLQIGELTHVVIHRDGVNYIRYVPEKVTRFIFDAYGH